jgi:UDP-N-acetylbacillosamine N-acetyltransferase
MTPAKGSTSGTPIGVKKERLVIWGASGHALVATDIVRLGKQYEIVGYLDDIDQERWDRPFCGNLVRGGRDQLSSLTREGVGYLFIAIGDCEARVDLAGVARAHGLKLATLIHPSAVLAQDLQVGAGSLIAAGAVLGPGVRLGENVIVNTSATVDHECVLGEGVHISPGAHLGGRVEIKPTTWVGLGSNVRDKVVVGSHSIVGAGSLVLEDLPDWVIAYGVPARVVSSRNVEKGKNPR